jgi:predicted DsbA family dithiol-disulfide isomerase
MHPITVANARRRRARSVASRRQKYGAGAGQLAERQALSALARPNSACVFACAHTCTTPLMPHWAASRRRQLELKRGLLRANHERGENPASPEVLLGAAAEAGLDRLAAGDAST